MQSHFTNLLTTGPFILLHRVPLQMLNVHLLHQMFNTQKIAISMKNKHKNVTTQMKYTTKGLLRRIITINKTLFFPHLLTISFCMYNFIEDYTSLLRFI